jgi:hypothetical protein
MAEPTPNPKVVDELKRLLAWAEKGTITELAFMAFGADTELFTVGYHYSSPLQIPHIAGETGALVTAIHNDMLRGRMPQQQRPGLTKPKLIG